MLTYIPQPRKKKNENMENFYKRLKLHRARGKFSEVMSTDEYKETLDELEIEYTEIELEKDSGRKVKIVIPTCQFQVMAKADISKLLKL